jgi:hypothetical protein
MKCHSCHAVHDIDLPPPVAEPLVPVVLGGPVRLLPTDGALITSIVCPSHTLAPGFARDAITSGRLSRMGDFSGAMTVQEMVDLVAFLQSTYVPARYAIEGMP